MLKHKPLTIAFLTNLYPPYVIGGNEIFTHDIAVALRQRGHSVHILTGRGSRFSGVPSIHQVLDIDLDRKEEVFLGGLPLTMRRVFDWYLFNFTTHRQVLHKLRQLQPDLTVAANLYLASAAPMIAARQIRAPFIAQPMDKWLVYNLKDLRRNVPAHRPIHRAALAAIKQFVQPLLNYFGKPDYILPVSEFIRRYYLDCGYPSKTSKSIYLGIPVELFPYKTHSFPGNRTWRLIFAGQLWSGKGPQVAIEAVKLLYERASENLPAIELDIYGSGAVSFTKHLQDRITSYGLSDKIRLQGFHPRDRLVDEFHRHDVLLFCSIWDEPFSIGLQEAMCAGIPTIATTAGGTPEAVRHEQNGLLVPPDDPQALADALARLMRDPALYEQIGKQAGKDVRTVWNFERFIDRLEDIYTAIARDHRRGAPINLHALPGADPWQIEE